MILNILNDIDGSSWHLWISQQPTTLWYLLHIFASHCHPYHQIKWYNIGRVWLGMAGLDFIVAHSCGSEWEPFYNDFLALELGGPYFIGKTCSKYLMKFFWNPLKSFKYFELFRTFWNIFWTIFITFLKFPRPITLTMPHNDWKLLPSRWSSSTVHVVSTPPLRTPSAGTNRSAAANVNHTNFVMVEQRMFKEIQRRYCPGLCGRLGQTVLQCSAGIDSIWYDLIIFDLKNYKNIQKPSRISEYLRSS